MKPVPHLLLATALLLGNAAAPAQHFAKPEDAITYRQNAFNLMQAHFSPLGAMASCVFRRT